jgi:nitrite reductase (NADH) large subunit
MKRLHYLIIGNGAAGVTAAETIRCHDALGQITIVGAEPYPVYSRPGLAYVLLNEIPSSQVISRQPEWYAQHHIQLVHGRAEHIQVSQQRLVLDTGHYLAYDRLLIATGARAVPPPYPGGDLAGVVYLDTLSGTQDLMRQARRARRAVVIGGGITALELTEGLAHHGVETHYLVRGHRLWGRVFNDSEAKLLEDRMRAHGVIIHYNAEVAHILGDRRGRVRGARLKDGHEMACNLVGVAIGVKPQIDLVRGTSIQVDRAILVNEFLESSVAGVYAAGDCAQVYDRWTQRHTLDILWPSAVAEGNAAGLNMAGRRHAYVKASPFNSCLLYGLHITAIGQINPGRDALQLETDATPDAEPEVIQYLSRGSSEVWFSNPRPYASAWSEDGPNTLRLVMSGDRLVGALVIGEQSLADPLRYIIEHQIDIGSISPYLRTGSRTMRQSLEQFWYQLGIQHAAEGALPGTAPGQPAPWPA